MRARCYISTFILMVYFALVFFFFFLFLPAVFHFIRVKKFAWENLFIFGLLVFSILVVVCKALRFPRERETREYICTNCRMFFFLC